MTYKERYESVKEVKGTLNKIVNLALEHAECYEDELKDKGEDFIKQLLAAGWEDFNDMFFDYDMTTYEYRECLTRIEDWYR